MGSLGFHVLQFIALDGSSKSKDEDFRGIRICKHDGIALILIQQLCQRIEMGTVINEKPIVLDGNFKLSNFKEIVCAGARKNSDAPGGRFNFLFEISVYANQICIDAFSLWSTGRISLGALRKFFTHKDTKITA